MIRGWIPSIAHGHWDKPFSDLNVSSHEFYNKVQQKIQEKQIDGLRFELVDLYEGVYFFSDKRTYLRITRNTKVIDVCCAPFADGTYFSWWLFEKEMIWETLLMKVPNLGPFIIDLMDPKTYHKTDSLKMYYTYIHGCVMLTVEEFTKELGSRGLTEEDKKPVMQDILRR